MVASRAMTRTLNAPLLVLSATLLLTALPYSLHFVSFLHPKELVLNLFLLALACCAPRPSWSHFRMLLPLWLLLAIGIVHLFFAQVPANVVVEMGRYATLLLIATFALPLLSEPRQANWLLAAMVGATVVVAILGLVQFFAFAPALFPVFPTYTQPVYSVFGNQDLFGAFCALGLVLVWGVEVGEKHTRFLHVPRLVLWLTLFLALVASGSRTAWLAAALGSTHLLFAQPRRVSRLLLFFYALAAGLLVVLLHPSLQTLPRLMGTLSHQDVGARIRLWLWDAAIRMFVDAPFLGVGWGNFQYWSPKFMGDALAAPYGPRHLSNELQAFYAHSEPLNLLTEGGLLAGILLLWLCARLLFPRRHVYSQQARVTAAALLTLVVFSLFNDAFHAAPHALAALILSGLLLTGGGHFAVLQLGDLRTPWLWQRDRTAIKPLILPLTAVLLLALNLWTTYIPSFLLAQAERAHVGGQESLSLYARALAHPWPQPRAHEQYALALIEHNEPRKAAPHLEWALRGQDTGQVYLYRGIAALALGNEDAARAAFAACLYRFPRNTGVWRRLYAITTPEARPQLEAHRMKWFPTVAQEARKELQGRPQSVNAIDQRPAHPRARPGVR